MCFSRAVAGDRVARSRVPGCRPMHARRHARVHGATGTSAWCGQDVHDVYRDAPCRAPSLARLPRRHGCRRARRRPTPRHRARRVPRCARRATRATRPQSAGRAGTGRTQSRDVRKQAKAEYVRGQRTQSGACPSARSVVRYATQAWHLPQHVGGVHLVAQHVHVDMRRTAPGQQRRAASSTRGCSLWGGGWQLLLQGG